MELPVTGAMQGGKDLRLDGRWFSLAAVIIAWAVAINHLRVEWSINEQYSYGWLVPWLALYLFGGRWNRRPTPDRPRHPKTALAILTFVSLGWLPIHMLQVSSPDWRLIGWALSGLAMIVSLGVLYLAGGKAWLIHFWIPVVLMLVAVPWPVPLEQNIVQALMQLVAGISMEALRWCGIPAVQQGNMVSLGAAGVVGIEEACSGVRSLQAMVMVALFLGEVWHTVMVRRLVLVVIGLAFAIGFNIARTFTLAWMIGTRGGAYLERWHDSVGFLHLGLCMATFGAIAYLSRNRRDYEIPAAGSGRVVVPSKVSWRWSCGFLTWIAIVWIGTELWYRSGEGEGGRSEIVVRWPEDSAGFRESSIPERTGVILRHDEGRSVVWEGPDGVAWAMIYLRWRPGSAAVQLARAHTPDVCLPATGARLEKDRGVFDVRAGDHTISVHAYTFTSGGGQTIHTFYIRAGDDTSSSRLSSDLEELTIRNRIRAGMLRRRNRGQQVIEVAIFSSRAAEEIDAAFREFASAAFRIREAKGR